MPDLSFTVPSWFVWALLITVVWFVLGYAFWQLTRGVDHLQNLQRKGSVVKSWPEYFAYLTLGPVGWFFFTWALIDRAKSRRVLHEFQHGRR